MSQTEETRETYPGDGRSVKSAGQLMKEVTEDLSTLIRKEIELRRNNPEMTHPARLVGGRNDRSQWIRQGWNLSRLSGG